MKKILYPLFYLSYFLVSSQTYLPECNTTFYSLTTNTSQASNTGAVNTPSAMPLVFPAFTSGLAVGPAFGFGINNPSFWTNSNDTLWYYNGTSFIKSNHKIGNANASGIGGSANFIYALDATTGQVYKYTGTGNAILLTTIASYTNSGLVQDLVGDDLDNFYALDLASPQRLARFNSAGSLVCSYALSGIPTSTNAAESFAIVGNTVNVQRGSEYYVGLISGSSISFTLTTHSLNPPVDFASCPISNSFSSLILSTGGNCLLTTLDLWANSSLGGVGYSWSGPGIVSSTSNQSVAVNLPGVYTCTLQNSECIPKISVSSFTVYSTPVISVSGNTTLCVGNTSTLTASGATSYTWLPGGLINSSIAITPSISVIYSLSGTGTGGCSGSGTIAVTVNPNPTLVTNGSPSVICADASSSLSASGALTYTWNPGGLTNSVVAVTPTISTIYSVSGTNSYNCISSETVMLVVNANPTLTTTASSTVICSGLSATLSASGAPNYTWNPGGMNGSQVTVSPTGFTNYTVTGMDANGCQDVSVISVSVNSNPVLSATVSSPTLCAGGNTSLSVSGANTYTWNPGNFISSAISASPSVTTQYTVIGTGVNGCNSGTVVTVTVNQNPVLITGGISGGLCSGTTGSLSVSGAANYTWNPGNISASTITVSPVSTTIYTVTGLDLMNCSSTASVIVTVTATPSLTALANPSVICEGNSSLLNVSGANSYTWSSGSIVSSSTTVSPVVNTSYIVTGANGICTSTTSVGVTVNPAPALSINNPSGGICSGSSKTLSASGATSYTWYPGSMSSPTVVVNPTVTTNYTLIGSYATGCTSSVTTLLTVILTPTVTLVSTSPSLCVGQTATLSASGAPNYFWLPGNIFNSTLSVSLATTSDYTVTGYSGICTDSKTISLQVNTNPTISASVSTPTICSGLTTTLSSTGAISYTWFPTGLTGSLVNVSPAVTTVYTVTGSNLAGCNATAAVNVSVSPSPTVTAVANPTALCPGFTFTCYASGADSYIWMPGAYTGSVIIDGSALTKTFTIYGTTGACTSTTSLVTVVNPVPSITIVATPSVLCINQTATITVTGASTYSFDSPPYSNINFNSATISFTAPGWMAAGAKGINNFGCIRSDAKFIFVNPGSIATISTTAPNFNNLCSGQSTTLFASNAASYTWVPSGFVSNSIVITPSVTMDYSVASTSSLGCVSQIPAAHPVFVTPTPTIISAANTYTSCELAALNLSVSGATNYSWSPGNLTGSNVVVYPVSNVVYTITGANGTCTATETIGVLTSPNPTVSVASSGTICTNDSFTLSASGASNYLWMPDNQSGQSISVSPNVTTTYSVSGSDASGCTALSTATVFVKPLPNIIAPSTPTQCVGSVFSLSASGAVNYTWLPSGLTGSNISVSPTLITTYSVLGSDSFGCKASATATVFVVSSPTIVAVANPTSQCAGSAFTLSASGAANYTWSPSNLANSTLTVAPTVNTSYTVVGSNGFCTDTKTVNVEVNPLPIVSINNSSPIDLCEGKTVSLNSSGAANYTWQPGSLSGNSVLLNPSISTNYTLIGASNFLCTDTLIFNVNIVSNPVVNATASSTLLCEGETATLTAIGANSYTWNTTAIGASLQINPAAITFTNYYVVGTNTTGCNSDTVFVTIDVQKCAGLEKFMTLNNQIIIYPNPTKGEFILKMDSSSESRTIEIYNSIGELILFEKLAAFETTLNLNNKSNGIYFVFIKESGRIIAQQKVIKD